MNFKSLLILALMAMLAGCLGCSNNGAITIPDPDNPVHKAAEHGIWGAFNVTWDSVSDELTLTSNRQLAAHWNVTPMLTPGYITLVITGWDPVNKVMTVEATLENPTDLDGYDVRAIITSTGSAELVNPDDFTKLFDIYDPPVANPFRAYAKNETNRKFWGKYAQPEQYIKTEVFELYFPDSFYTTFIVTAAWPDNAPEPYDIVDIQQIGTLYESSGSIDVTIEVLDWQDVTADDVVIEANPVTVDDVHLTQTDATHWETTITNDGGVSAGEYVVWVAAYDAVESLALYNRFTIVVEEDIPEPGWSNPILVSGAPGADEILPRLALLNGEYWVVYTEGTAAVARKSTDGGYTWSAPETIGGYNGIDTIHAVVGGDNCIYVQYQKSDTKYTYNSKYDGTGWASPINTSYMGMTLPPFSCDLGIGSDGHIYGMTTGDWSTFGFRSNNPYDITAWTSDPIEAFYHGIYSINDGFVQQATIPKFFYVHEETQLDYAEYDGGWSKAAARTGTDTLIEPAIAPESDNPYHGVMGIFDGTSYEVEYFRYTGWPPTAPYIVSLNTGLSDEPIFHSISVEGNTVSIFYDADGEVLYAESIDGGGNFDPDVVLGGGGGSGGCAYSHIRHDPHTNSIIAAYAELESGDYNIYVRIKS